MSTASRVWRCSISLQHTCYADTYAPPHPTALQGVTRSEMRAVHNISKTLNRDVLLVSTDVLTPNRYLEALGQLSTLDEM